MGSAVLDKLTNDRDGLIERVDGITKADDFDPDSAEYVASRAEIDKLNTQIAGHVEWQKTRQAAADIDQTILRLDRKRDPAGDGVKRQDQPQGMGDVFIRSAAWENYKDAPRGTSSQVKVPSDLLQRAPLLTTSGTGQPWVTPTRIQIARPERQTPLLDLVQRIPVASNSVDWITYPAAAPLAAIVAEGTAKPEAAITATQVTVTLDTIAHWAQASRQLLEDSGAARALIEGELSRGVLDKIEAEIAAAITAATLPAVTDADLMAAIRIAVGRVQSAGFQPNAVVLNPADYAALDIDVYVNTLRGPSSNGSFWGLRPVAVGAQAAGTAVVGDFTAAVNYLERTDVSVYVTDSHASTFISNVFTFLAEARGKGVVTRAEALCEATGTATTGTATASAQSQPKQK